VAATPAAPEVHSDTLRAIKREEERIAFLRSWVHGQKAWTGPELGHMDARERHARAQATKDTAARIVADGQALWDAIEATRKL
jgi:hypothetical protein